MTDSHQVFEIADFALDSGDTLRPARLAYQTYGTLNAEKSNAIVYPTAFADQHPNNEWLIGPGRALDPEKYFIIVPNLFGNGLSSSPSNTPAPQDRARFPRVSFADNVRAQHRLVTEHFGIERLCLVTGWSMAASQTYQWAVSYPDMVERALPFCGAPRLSPHAFLFFEGVKAALTADAAWQAGEYATPPETGLRAFGRGYAAWGFSQAFYWQERYRELGFASLGEFLTGFWEQNFLSLDANDLLAMLWTGQNSDPASAPEFGGDLTRALGSIRARLISLPAEKDLYFPPEDEQWAASHIPHAEVRVIPGIWGHMAGRGIHPTDVAFIDDTLRELLATPVG